MKISRQEENSFIRTLESIEKETKKNIEIDKKEIALLESYYWQVNQIKVKIEKGDYKFEDLLEIDKITKEFQSQLLTNILKQGGKTT